MTAIIETQLNERHQAAREAYVRRDADAYVSIFTPDLVYHRHDGQTLDRDRLARDVKEQLGKLDRADSHYVREAITAGEAEATETLTQTAMAGVTIFGIIHRDMQISRRGHYTWRRDADQWRINRVEILSEKLTSTWRFGL